MPIYRYKEGAHKAGFVGFRVAVHVGKELKQKYFSTNKLSIDEIKELKKKAEELHDHWMWQQNAVAAKNLNTAKETQLSLYSTGVRGIKMKYLIKKKRKEGKIVRYYTPAFVVSGSTNTKRFNRNFNILTQGYLGAWVSAVLFLALNKNMSDPDNLIQRRPPVEKIMVIFRHMHSLGHKIPKERLPAEVLKNSQVNLALQEHSSHICSS